MAQKKPVSIKAARKKKEEHPLSYWQEKLPGWSGLEYCNQYDSGIHPEGDDWKPDGWSAMWDMIIDMLRPGVRAAVLEAEQAA